MRPRSSWLLGFSITLLLLFSIPRSGISQFWQWRSWTSSRQIRQVAADSSGIWAATSGGLVFVDAATLEITKYTNTEGLASNDLRAVTVDRQGRVWIGLGNGYLNVLDPATGQIELVKDYEGWDIHDLAVKGDSLYVALSLGVSLYLLDRREVKETYKNLGLRFPVEIAARSIAVWHDTLWVCTDFGIAYADLRIPNLQAPDFWQDVTSEDGLPSEEVRDVLRYDGHVYAATAEGLAVQADSVWRPAGFEGEDIVDLEIWGDDLLVVTRWGVDVVAGGQRTRLGQPLRRCVTATIDRLGRPWIGREEDGLAVYVADSDAWQDVVPNEPRGNNITDMAIDQDGVLWCTSLYSGAFSFDGVRWRHYTVATGHLPTDKTLCVAVDEQNRKWIGTQGRGLVVFTETDTGFAVTHYSSEDGKLAGSDTPTYVIISDVAVDATGNVWILNKFANNGRAVAVVTPTGNWTYFSTYEGLKSNRLISVAFDQLGRAWVGTETEGVQVIDFGTDLLDHTDDDLSQGLTSTGDGLRSNLVRALAADRLGVVWIGTDRGLNFWFDGQVGIRWGLISEDIYRIAVDPQDNKWVGTVGGITILDPDGYPMRHFTTQNSPLVWDHVQAFAFHPESGDAFIGTTNGISQVTTPYTAPKSDLSEVEVYPNPFILRGEGEKLTITNLARESRVRIYTAEGLLVRNFLPGEVPGGRVLWDGRNDRGELVASGVYLVLVTTRDGQSAVRKVAIVR